MHAWQGIPRLFHKAVIKQHTVLDTLQYSLVDSYWESSDIACTMFCLTLVSQLVLFIGAMVQFSIPYAADG